MQLIAFMGLNGSGKYAIAEKIKEILTDKEVYLLKTTEDIKYITDLSTGPSSALVIITDIKCIEEVNFVQDNNGLVILVERSELYLFPFVKSLIDFLGVNFISRFLVSLINPLITSEYHWDPIKLKYQWNSIKFKDSVNYTLYNDDLIENVVEELILVMKLNEVFQSIVARTDDI